MRAPIGVLIVEGGAASRAALQRIVAGDPRLTVVGAVADAEAALIQVERLAPDVIAIDPDLPGDLTAAAAARRIMSERPTPIVLTRHARGDPAATNAALAAGAMIKVELAARAPPGADARLGRRLCDALVDMSGVATIRRRPLATGGAGSAGARARAGTRVVGMVASTGGPTAIATVLNRLPPGFAAPILVVQHMNERFVDGFVRWLDATCHLDVVVARHGEVPRRGTVHVGPGGYQLTLCGERLHLTTDGAAGGHRPSGDVLLTSLAEAAGPRAIGVVLTGMGVDGAAGLLRMRQAGAHTIAQNERTSIVYGMPAAAMRLGAAIDQLAIEAIPDRIRELVR